MRYSAFISYNHRDRKVAAWLHRALETYRIPRRFNGRIGPIGTIDDRLPPVFRDREELSSSPDLARSVLDALTDAATLIVICSPDAARSRWVNEEIRSFRVLGRGQHIQCLVVAGEPYASRRPEFNPALECFPSALLEDGSREPLAADLRPGMDGKHAAKLKLLAQMLGVSYGELRDRETARRHRRLATLAAASLAGFVLMAGLAVFALIQRQQAIADRDLAREKTQTAERTVDFVQSLFEVADPSESKGESITAREVLDHGARRIEQSLKNEPSVKTELMTTLSEVYGALGLFKRSDALVRDTFAIAGRDVMLAPRQFMVLGESQVRLGDYTAATGSFESALAVARRRDYRQPELLPRMLIGLSEAQAGNNNFLAAQATAREALSLASAPGTATPARATALEALGEAYFYDDKPDTAEPFYRTAIALRTADEGALHPRVTEDLNTLGAIAYLRQQPDVAARYYRRVLDNDQAVLGAEHPDTAITLNSLGRVVLEQGKYREAYGYLARAAAITRRQRDETHDEFAFIFDNLGLAERALGHAEPAEQLFRKALVAATIHNHRNRAPVMTDLADLLCSDGRTIEALALLTLARPLMTRTYPEDPWRVAWLDNVQGGCLLAQGDRAGAAKLIAASTPVLQKRWPAESLYGAAAARRLRDSTRAGAAERGIG
ncbi:toll/interleukin-1 receptor domain-containing protein [Sphingosinicellaceae bacterium]|nr:toll/interleukin-1 receptor domain-containing protein [Sphingosinicellaceae bacterium]